MKSSQKFLTWSRLFKEAIVMLWIQAIVITPGFSAQSEINFSKEDILKYSHISYSAQGGFTGVKSYSVLVSCIEGKVSVLKSINDPKSRRGSIRHKGRMTKSEYLALWNSMKRQNTFEIKDAPAPKKDLRDEFTYYFDFQVGDQKHNFSIYGMSRPLGARYFALVSLIDKASNMASLWSRHSTVARR